ncbi:PAS domain-containing protein [Rhodovibrionaceae bacterium A322]
MVGGTPLPEKMQGLMDLWHDKKGSQSLPLRREFDPFLLKPWLGYLILIEVCDDGADFYYRLNGTALREELGFDWTGAKLSELPKRLWPLMEEYRRIVASREPEFVDRAALIDRPYTRVNKLMLPLSKEGAAVDFLLVCIYPCAEDTLESPNHSPLVIGL